MKKPYSKGIHINKRLNIKCFAPPGQENNVTALMFAQSTEAVEMLPMAGASLKDSDGWTPLMRVTCNGKVDAVKTLLENGADYRQKTVKKKRLLTLHVKGCDFMHAFPIMNKKSTGHGENLTL